MIDDRPNVEFPRRRSEEGPPVRVVAAAQVWKIAGTLLLILVSFSVWALKSMAHQEAVLVLDAHNRDPEAHAAIVKLLAQSNETKRALESISNAQAEQSREISKLAVDVALIKGQLSKTR